MEYPKKVYKYRSLSDYRARSFARKIIARREIYAPPPASFNDPFDCRPTYELQASDAEVFDYQLRIAKKYSPHLTNAQVLAWAKNPARDIRSPRMLDFMQDMAEVQLTEQIGVLCVSASCTDILMWSHYADSHGGVCLEFDTSFSPFKVLREVGYKPERTAVRLMQDDGNVMAEKSVLSKSLRWEYEKEWRYINYLGPVALPFDSPALTGIILGARISKENLQRVRRWALRAPQAVLYQAVPHRTKYEMTILRVPD